MLFKVIIQISDDNLQKAMFRLKNILVQYRFRIFASILNTMEFGGKYLLTKIIVGDNIIKQDNNFNYLGNLLR